MSLETDLLLDRRRLKRRLAAWRVAAVLAVAAAVLVATAGQWEPFGLHHIARLSVTGIITEDAKLTREITDVAEDASVSALIVSIDSPGGSVAGGESLHNAIAHVAAVKPVVTVMHGTAASAGYMIAVPAARIFARESTLTGSIGVLLETGDVSGLLAKLGVTSDLIVSGPLKGQPSFTQPLSAQGRDVLQGLVADMYDQFVGMVAQGRHMAPDAVRALADGRAYTGRQALKLGLIDAIGGEDEARAWLAQSRGVSATLPVRDLGAPSLARRALGDSLMGLWKTVLSQGLTLDGAWAVWQPSAQ